MSMLNGLNHITLSTSNLERAIDFYINILGFKGHVKWQTGAYLTLGEIWLCLTLGDVADTSQSDYSHIAFDIDPKGFNDFKQALINAGVKQWKENSSEGDSLYLLDPDGHKLEVHAGNLMTRLESLKTRPYQGLIWMT